MRPGLFASVQHSSTADEVIRQVEWLILQGVLRPGDRLPAERELSLQLGVSRPVLRDALKDLETRGLILSRHGGGTFVADVISDVFTEPVMDLIASHRRAIDDYLDYRKEIEAVAAGMAAERATNADLAMLSSVIETMRSAHKTGDFTEEAKADVEFHNTVSEIAHNIVLLHTLRSCYRLHMDGVFYNRTLLYSLPGVRADLLAQHEAIAYAITSRNADAARKASRDHIAYVEQKLAEAETVMARDIVSRLRLTRSENRKPSTITAYSIRKDETTHVES
jgi:GntR family transcriptional regulator, transcriptional repressor for pyruvate dehydrogenase complex